MDSLKDLFPRMENEESTEDAELEYSWWVDIYAGGHGFNFRYSTREAVVEIGDIVTAGEKKFVKLMDNEENYVLFRTSEISVVNARREKTRRRGSA